MGSYLGNAPVANNNYGIANGANSTAPLLTLLMTRDPTSNDINYQVKQRWINTSSHSEWILVSFTQSNNITVANWIQLSDGNALIGFTGGTGTTGFPVTPNSSGQLQLTSLDQSLLLTGSTNSIDFKVNFQIKNQVFTTSGTYTPTSGMRYCEIVCLGAGGAGGGTVMGGGSGGGGGAGSYTVGIFSAAQIGVSQSVTIGSGGTGNSASDGSAGSATSVGIIISSNGGSGGKLSSNNLGQGGLGGASGSGGDYRTPGYNGQYGTTINGGSAGGAGANSQLGSGGIAASGGTFGGNIGLGYGSGGSGGVGVSTTGGNGANGIVIIKEYIFR